MTDAPGTDPVHPGPGDPIPRSGPVGDAPTGTGGRRRRVGLWIALPLLIVLGLFVGVLATREPATDRRAASPLVGLVGPAVAGPTIDEGRFDMTDLRGRFVVVNFFATWCTPCRREHPELVNFARRHEAAGDAAVVSVLFDDQRSQAREFFDEQGGDWPVVVDPEGRIALDYGVAAVPESFIIGPDGRVAAKLVGGVTASGLDAVLLEVRGS